MKDTKDNIVKYEKLFYEARDQRMDGLKFYTPLEKLYKSSINLAIYNSMGLILIWALLLFYSFLIVDFFMLPKDYPFVWKIRIFVVTPFFLINYYLAKKFAFFKENAEYIICLNTLIAGFSDIPLVYLSGGSFQTFYYVFTGYSAIIFFAQGFMGIRFWYSMITLFLGLCGFLPFLNFANISLMNKDIILELIMIGVIDITGLLSIYRKEFFARKSFIDANLLRIESKKLKEAQEDLKILAETDSMTGLLNKRTMHKKFDEVIDISMRMNTPFSVVIMDVDYFKLYNDTYGHTEGDKCLIAVSNCIKSVLKRTTDIAARFGGEEFILLLPQTDQAGAMTVAENIRKNLEALNMSHDKSTYKYVTISLGVHTVRLDRKMLTKEERKFLTERLIANADNALYQSKQNGRNRVTYFFPKESISGTTQD